MSIFDAVKDFYDFHKKNRSYAAMSSDELLSLDDESLYRAVSGRIINETKKLDAEDVMKKYSGAKLDFYVVDYFSQEVNGGGLCQYFMNPGRDTFPRLLHSLKAVGAEKYFNLVNDFVIENKISARHLDSFDVESEEEYEELMKKYPFEEFDKSFFELEQSKLLDEFLVEFARKNITEFENQKG